MWRKPVGEGARVTTLLALTRAFSKDGGHGGPRRERPSIADPSGGSEAGRALREPGRPPRKCCSRRSGTSCRLAAGRADPRHLGLVLAARRVGLIAFLAVSLALALGLAALPAACVGKGAQPVRARRGIGLRADLVEGGAGGGAEARARADDGVQRPHRHRAGAGGGADGALVVAPVEAGMPARLRVNVDEDEASGLSRARP